MTMKVELINAMGSDLSVVNAARVSFAKKSDELDAKDLKLINYLAEHKHWSPFAHSFLQFHIKAPIFVARQLVKHQVGLSWNEVSRRYVDDDPEFFTPRVWRGRPTNSKQGSNGLINSPSAADTCLKEANQQAAKHYQMLLALGVAPEMARMVLPQTLMTEWYWSGSLYAFARVCNQRLDRNTQQETQTIAAHIHKHCSDLFPHSWAALTKEANTDA